jgi:FKBP-type peptidyl-prolyl cis-trans isomerase FklB
MKKIILSFIMMGCLCVLKAQPTKPSSKPAPQPANVLKTSTDSISYVLGEVAAYGLIRQGLGEVKFNNAPFQRALNDVLGKKKILMPDSVANLILTSYMLNLNIDQGKNFLAKNKLKPGVKTTASGLQYEVVKEGTGIKPTVVDTFVVNYRGTLLNGTEFDASANRGEPLKMGVSQVIPGWTEGLQLMSVGSKYKFWIPYNLGYGERGSGQAIPGGATLVFDLELLDVKKKQ